MKRELVIFLFILSASLLTAQDDKITMSVGPAATDAKQAAIAMGLKLFDSYGAIMNSTQIVAGDKWYMYMAPQVSTDYGSGDVFDGFIIKGTGMFRFYSPTSIAGITVVDEKKLSWVVPFSVDMETNKDFKNFNIIGEIGLIPWYKTIANANHINNKILRQLCSYTNVAAFVQGGNKLGKNGSSDSLSVSEGTAVQSRESIDGGICRLKLMANFSPTLLKASKEDFAIRLKGEATYWYDFINRANYYQVIVNLNIQVIKNLGLDVGYQRGSGAPNFNEGGQFAGKLNLSF